jgi:hypothetical protein
MRIVRENNIGRGYRCQLVCVDLTHAIAWDCKHSYQLYMITPSDQHTLYGHLKRKSNSFQVSIRDHMMLRKHHVSKEAIEFANAATEWAAVDFIFVT